MMSARLAFDFYDCSDHALSVSLAETRENLRGYAGIFSHHEGSEPIIFSVLLIAKLPADGFDDRIEEITPLFQEYALDMGQLFGVEFIIHGVVAKQRLSFDFKIYFLIG